MTNKKTALFTLPGKIWGLLLFAFIVRILIFILFQPWNELVVQKQILQFDALGYHNLALCIKNNFTFKSDDFRNNN